MFEELKAQLTFQNVQKIKKRQRQLDSLSDSGSKDPSDYSYSQEDQFSERLQMFKLLMDENRQGQRRRNTQKQIENVKLGKLIKQKQLLKEKMKIDQEQFSRESIYLQQKHARQVEALKAEIEKYQYQLQKFIKEEGVVLNLKKENRQLVELYSQCSDTAERKTAQNASLNKEIIRLKAIIAQKEEREAYLSSQQPPQSQNEKTLKLQIQTLQKEKASGNEKKKQLQATIQRLRTEIDEVTREFDQFKFGVNHQKQQLIERNKVEINRLQKQNDELKKRNQKLQESFIEHLTQTSLNLQHNLRHLPDKSGKNTTLYLQETPIKSRSRQRQSRSPEQQDPQKNQCSAKQCPTSHQLSRFKLKLKQANAKIVQLLQQKCSGFRQR